MTERIPIAVRETKPRLLDLFSGAGGCTKGYQRAGFYVVGVDIAPQPNYCGDEFVQMDALDYTAHEILGVKADDFDAIHASPPCQRYIRGGLSDKAKHPDLIGRVREFLEYTALPYVIENVPGAPMRPDIVLCGSQFGLEVRRHRWFETSWGASPLTPPCDHLRPVTGVYGNAHGKAGAWPGMLPSDLGTWSKAMGIFWMTAREITDAIPPSYTEFVGLELMKQIQLEVAA